MQVSSFLRKFLGSLNSKDHSGLILLNDELEIIRIFLEMQNVLHNGRLDWSINLSEDIDPTEWLVPPLLLQPYVENAIVWGIDCKENKEGSLCVNIRESDSQLHIEIIDDGIGIEEVLKLYPSKERKMEESGAHIVRQRLALLKSLGIHIHLEINSSQSGTIVRFTYPKVQA
ncbi:MAG: hypothetical protein IPI50_01540 [Saprospiraceae bacterium]|nr:hypothetical protein [Saprospiraceae bacterium]